MQRKRQIAFVFVRCLQDPTDPDGVQSGANPTCRRCVYVLELIDDPVQSEVDCVEFEVTCFGLGLVSPEVVHIYIPICNIYV